MKEQPMSILYDLGGSVVRLEEVMYLKKQRSKMEWLILMVFTRGATHLLYFKTEEDRDKEYDKMVKTMKEY